MTITDAIISQFVNNPGKELHILDIVKSTGHNRHIVSSGLYRIRDGVMLANLVKTGRGAYTFKPKEGVEPYKNMVHQLHDLLQDRKSATHKEIVDTLGIHENYVQELVCRMNRVYGTKAKREVRYVIPDC
ncbi:hypothetical protein VPHK391_0038 [Vibrio phage K391]